MAERRPSSSQTVAIVGSGMAGLVSAYLLQNDQKRRFEVEIFETQDHLSLDSASHTIDEHAEKKDRIDLPMRAFSPGFYDNLKRMYDYLGVESTSPRFIYSLIQADSSNDTSYYLHSSSLHRLPQRPEGRTFISWIIEVCYLTICYFWFTACCFYVRPRSESVSREGESLREYLQRIRIPWYYTKNYLLPLLSSVTTCTHEATLEFPAIDIVDYERKTFRQPHYTVIGGVDCVQKKLSKDQKVRLGATVTAVENIGTKVQITWKDARNGEIDSALFDHVILAVTPNVVGSIYQPLQSAMASVPTVPVDSIVHNDYTGISSCSKSLKRKLLSEQGSTRPQVMHMRSNPTATECIHEHPSSALITTFPLDPIDPAKVIHRARFTRVLRTPRSREIVNDIFSEKRTQNARDDKQHLWRNGDGNVWLVGGWCWDAMVVLEGCVVSAMRVADGLDVEVPWRK
ncbi:hypothetical protein FQN54_002745 [Arachnomyces sp. PD_36]|nr:hypothetical protein FQN54_002745 [Arachnomyces sp. PD_36]